MSKKKKKYSTETMDQIVGRDVESKKIFDIEWLKKNDIGDDIYKTNEMQSQLAYQWGSDLVVDDVREMKKSIKPVCMLDELAQQKVYVLRFAREKMMEGLMGKELIASIKNKFTRETIKNTYKDLKKVLAYEGVIGCTAIDAQDYTNAKEAAELIKKSPYAKHIKYVLMSPNDNKFTLASIRKTESNSTGDLNGIIASESVSNETHIPVCAVTGMKVIACHCGFDGAGSMANGTDAVSGEDKQGEVEVLGEELNKSACMFREMYNNRKQKPQMADNDYDKTDYKLDCGGNDEIIYDKIDNTPQMDLGEMRMNVNCDVDINPETVRYNDEVEVQQPYNVFNETNHGGNVQDIMLSQKPQVDGECQFGSSGLIV